jgi:hypothetical protein
MFTLYSRYTILGTINEGGGRREKKRKKGKKTRRETSLLVVNVSKDKGNGEERKFEKRN